MTLKNQFEKIKENWLLVLIVLLLFGSMFLFSIGSVGIGNYKNTLQMAESSYDYGGGYRGPSYGNDNFAPKVEERIITKRANIRTDVERGEFFEEQSRLKTIINNADAYLLDENLNVHGEKWKKTYSGSYQIKVDTEKYEGMLSQLREIGEVQSFSENMDDITGIYTDLNVELEAEKARLTRYQNLYEEAEDIEDKIELDSKIFDQERRIKYLEDRIDNMDNRVTYSTISFSMYEERSEWVDITVAKFSDLIRSLVGSFNAMLYILFMLVPWIVVVVIVSLILRFFKRSR